jgi:hypothetical protein
MRSEVTVNFKGSPALQIKLDDQPAMPNADARVWLDQQFTEMGCEPLRPTGKLLTADKVVVIAEAAGLKKFQDPVWSLEFARAASAALGRPLVHIDVEAMGISY